MAKAQRQKGGNRKQAPSGRTDGADKFFFLTPQKRLFDICHLFDCQQNGSESYKEF